MKLHLLYFLHIIPFINCLRYSYQENFTVNDSLQNIVNHKFISDLKQKKLSNFKMYEKNKNTKIIQYSGRKYGYPYQAHYNIYQKNDDLFKIRYYNSFLKNDIHLQKFKNDKILVKVDIITSLPIPQIIIEKIVYRKLDFLRD